MNQTKAPSMPDFLTLTCPTCGAKLKLNEKIHLLVCASCGNEHMVHRDGGAIYLAPIAQDVRQIRVSTDKTAAELAIPRLKAEIKAIEAEAEETRARNYADRVKASSLEGWLTVGMILGLLFAVGGILFLAIWFSVACGVVILALAFWYSSVNANRMKEADKLRQLDLERVQTRHTEKSRALAKNQQIANS